MIYVMDTKTLIKDFTKNEGSDIVLTAQYCIISSRIRRTDENDAVVNITHLMYPTKYTIMDLSEDESVQKDYINQLSRLEPTLFLSNIVKASIKEGYDIIFLCSPNEYNLGYMKILSEYIENTFYVPCIEYKYRNKHKSRTYSDSMALKVCKEIKHQRKYQLTKSKKGRESLVKNMSKKEKIDILKSMDIYYKGMDKDDIDECIEVYFIED